MGYQAGCLASAAWVRGRVPGSTAATPALDRTATTLTVSNLTARHHYGMSYPSAYAAATSGVPARQASGLINTAQQMGGAVGLAVISAVAASYTASLTRDSGPQALTSGYNLAMAVAAGFTLLASVIAATVIRVRRPAPAGPAAVTGLGTPTELGETVR